MQRAKKRIRIPKELIIGLAMFLTSYPVGELTRCIWLYNRKDFDTWIELAAIWISYLLMPVIINLGLDIASGKLDD